MRQTIVCIAFLLNSFPAMSAEIVAAKGSVGIASGEIHLSTGETLKVQEFKVLNPEGFKEIRLACFFATKDKTVELCEDDLRAKLEVYSLTQNASPYFIAPFSSVRFAGGGVSFPLESGGARVVLSVVAIKSFDLTYQVSANSRKSTVFGAELNTDDLLAFDHRFCRLQGNMEGLKWLYEISEGDHFEKGPFSFDSFGELQDMLSPECVVTASEQGKDPINTSAEDFVRCLAQNLFMFQSAFETVGTPSIAISGNHAVIRTKRRLIGNPRMGKPVQPLLEMDEELRVVKRNGRLVAESVMRTITANHISKEKSALPAETGK